MKYLKSFVFVFILSIITIRPVMAAYIDPNTGGMLFQILAVLFGVISGLLLFFSSQIKKGFYRFRRYVRDLFVKDQEDE